MRCWLRRLVRAADSARSGRADTAPLRRHGVEGQATVELVALLPLVGLVVALLWQALLAGATLWLSGGAARAAARAVAVGGDPVAAARGVLPARLERGLQVRRERGGTVEVVLRVPVALGNGTIAPISTRARFEAQR